MLICSGQKVVPPQLAAVKCLSVERPDLDAKMHSACYKVGCRSFLRAAKSACLVCVGGCS